MWGFALSTVLSTLPKGSLCHPPAAHEPDAVGEFRVRAAPRHHGRHHAGGPPAWPQDAGNTGAGHRLQLLKLICQFVSPSLPGLGTPLYSTQLVGAE